MATLYFRTNTSGGGNDGDWSNANNWWTSIAFTTHAGRVPNSGDTVYICDAITNVSGAASVTVNTAYFGTTSPVYAGYWEGGGSFTSNADFNCQNCYIVIGHVWTGNGSFIVSSLTVVQGNSNIQGGAFYQTGGSVNFYDNSTNAGPDDVGLIALQNNAVCNFYNYSANSNVGGINSGSVSGIVNFYDYSTNGQADGGDGVNGYVNTGNFHNYSSNGQAASNQNGQTNGTGYVFGGATFYDHATNYSYVNNSFGLSTAAGIVGSLVYTYSRPVSELVKEIQCDCRASSATIPVTSGGISRSNVLLTQLLKLPFPVIA